MKHIVNQLQIEIHCPDEGQALGMRHNFAQTFQQRIEEVMDRVCSQYIPDNESVQIDTLAFDLGIFSSHSFQDTFVDIFADKFEQALVQKIAALPNHERRTSVGHSQLELFKYILLHGTTPWWVDQNDVVLNDIAWILVREQPHEVRSFLTANSANAAVWSRIVFQLNSEVQHAITIMVTELTQGFILIEEWIRKIEKYIGHEMYTEKTRSFITTILLKAVPSLSSKDYSNDSFQFVFDRSIPDLFIDNAAYSQSIVEAWRNIKASSGLPESIVEGKVAPFVQDAITTDEKYITKHGGVVLLAQFLRPFFQKLGLLEGVAWKNKPAQYKAVQLVGFLGTGEEYTPEYSLVLEKIICGVPLEEPIPVNAALSRDDLDEAEVLLRAVIEHWSALRNSSVQGLRDAFLVRDGVLVRTNMHWQLQVERKTIDVLLDKIPWGYSVIIMPWNDYPIYVEW
jgi:hypothetical protein